MPQRHVAHSSCAGVFSASRATLVGAKTARGAACGRTRAQADRCPHNGVPDWPTAVRNLLTRSGHPACRAPRSDELIGTSGASHTSHEQPRRPDAGVGVHRDDRRNSGCHERPVWRCCRDRRSVLRRERARRLRCRLRGDLDRPPQPRHRPQGLTALRNLDHRGARGAEPDTGDGAGILIQVPDAFLRAVVDFALPPAGAYAVGIAFLPDGRRRRPRPPSRGSRGSPPRRTSRVLGWREVPDRRRRAVVGATARGRDAAVPPALRRLGAARRRRRASPSSGWRSACASAPSTRPACTSRRCRRGRSSTRACSTTGQLEPFFPDLSDRAVRHRAGPRALPVLDQHVPVVAAGPPVPAHRAQRRDQHRAGQPQLDARPRGAARLATLIPGDLQPALPDLHPGRQRLGELRRGARAAAPGRPQPAARGADDDPGGVGEPRRDGPGPPGLLRVPLHADGAVGRPGAASASPTARSSAPCSTATACAPPASGSPTTAWSCSPPRSASSTSTPADRRAQGPAAAGPDVPRRHRRRADRRRRRDQGRAGRAAPVRGLAARRAGAPRRPARARARRPSPRPR